MQAYRRLASNHALDFAYNKAIELGKTLIVYEGLRMDYPWNSERIHKFILEGMCDNKKEAEKLGLPYWCYVETPKNPSKGLLAKISQQACLIVTDDFPCFIIPEQIERLSEKVDCSVIAVDGNGIIPLNLYGNFASAARVLRTRIHKLIPEAYIHQATPHYTKSKIQKAIQLDPTKVKAPFTLFSCEEKDIATTLKLIPFQNDVKPFEETRGGRKEALKILQDFLVSKLPRYGSERSNPNSPDKVPSSLMSPYLHFGHISSEEIISAVLDISISDNGKWAPDLLNPDFRGKRENFYSNKEFVNSYLDELITWRDTGYQWFWQKPSFRKNLDELPNWVKDNFAKHKKDKRDYQYTKEEWMLGKTHDPIWNAAQNELRITGRMHNYMRMLWGKKVIEWSPTIEEAFDLLEEMNNLYAYDGRNPNSYTGILWCFGMFDRPWFPERNVLGNIRYMSSDSTKKKFKLASYLDYVAKLTDTQGSLF
ncbi:MAG: deoxyribodipyrimidine photolyase [Leptospira sp.]|nr:deoxyribodipyrimidine photolyase [Leptospira sp.]